MTDFAVSLVTSARSAPARAYPFCADVTVSS